ncbi:Rpp14/Pop5 family protein [Haloquadratum walsbyi]|jgi:ribonuclease P protein subunit Rpp14 (EC 3.1.26.5)|uniref:Ribonuclease P protein component 2 n=1 Tax=Haloquadratum walsbyi J07HQW2 TaxID=1238425 RepID=U1N109_9EURY|nr:Rpp14/Pop5 family protein [Haloquadratum walsbyi]ERG96514.1 MAG: RNase P/RNase MRP subunit POP5 [Haloquadratum walsbyi J07HQW2]
MKHLPKHLRPRWRYLAVVIESWPDASIDRATFQRELWYAAQDLYGDTQSAETDLAVFYFEFTNGRGETIIRTRRDTESHARTAVACINEIDDYAVGIRVLGISGTVRACEERYLNGRTGCYKESNVVFKNESRPAVIRGLCVDVATGSIDDTSNTDTGADSGCDTDTFTGATRLDFE